MKRRGRPAPRLAAHKAGRLEAAMEDDRQQRIRDIAHRIWEEEGCPDDQEERHWRMAENIVAQEDAEREGLAPHSTKKPEGDGAGKA
jgi:hypothetical protein